MNNNNKMIEVNIRFNYSNRVFKYQCPKHLAVEVIKANIRDYFKAECPDMTIKRVDCVEGKYYVSSQGSDANIKNLPDNIVYKPSAPLTYSQALVLKNRIEEEIKASLLTVIKGLSSVKQKINEEAGVTAENDCLLSYLAEVINSHKNMLTIKDELTLTLQGLNGPVITATLRKFLFTALDDQLVKSNKQVRLAHLTNFIQCHEKIVAFKEDIADILNDSKDDLVGKIKNELLKSFDNSANEPQAILKEYHLALMEKPPTASIDDLRAELITVALEQYLSNRAKIIGEIDPKASFQDRNAFVKNVIDHIVDPEISKNHVDLPGYIEMIFSGLEGQYVNAMKEKLLECISKSHYTLSDTAGAICEVDTSHGDDMKPSAPPAPTLNNSSEEGEGSTPFNLSTNLSSCDDAGTIDCKIEPSAPPAPDLNNSSEEGEVSTLFNLSSNCDDAGAIDCKIEPSAPPAPDDMVDDHSSVNHDVSDNNRNSTNESIFAKLSNKLSNKLSSIINFLSRWGNKEDTKVNNSPSISNDNNAKQDNRSSIEGEEDQALKFLEHAEQVRMADEALKQKFPNESIDVGSTAGIGGEIAPSAPLIADNEDNNQSTTEIPAKRQQVSLLFNQATDDNTVDPAPGAGQYEAYQQNNLVKFDV